MLLRSFTRSPLRLIRNENKLRIDTRYVTTIADEKCNNLKKQLDKILETVPKNKKDTMTIEFTDFQKLFRKFLTEKTVIDWKQLDKLPNQAIEEYSSLKIPSEEKAKHILSKLVVVKLNGGLGTLMGCKGPKSTITLKNNKNFLQLTVEQLIYLNDKYKVNVPLVLMNSFNTDCDTHKVLKEFGNKLNIEVHTFTQSAYPRIDALTYSAIPTNGNIEENKEAWYPPGHGDFYTSFHNCGLLDKYVKEDKRLCFVSNIDNLGATVDLNILDMALNSEKHEFIMEVTRKTKADVKGGALIQYNGKAGLLETGQVPNDHQEDFKDIKVLKYFNTNNIWIKLEAIRRNIKEDNLHMEVIADKRTMKNGTEVYQLETAVGAAMKSFKGSIGLNVPRCRFLPVKKTQDLLLLKSNLYVLENGNLVLSKERDSPTMPVLKLGDDHYRKIEDFQKRFKDIPDMVELDHFTVAGDVVFGKNIKLKGNVIIISHSGSKIYIPDGSILKDKVMLDF